jgi:hypothetical protein
MESCAPLHGRRSLTGKRRTYPTSYRPVLSPVGRARGLWGGDEANGGGGLAVCVRYLDVGAGARGEGIGAVEDPVAPVRLLAAP